MDKDERLILHWRVQRAVPFGLHVWFDPSVETLRLYHIPCDDELEPPVLSEKVDKQGMLWYPVRYGSVSAFENEDEPVTKTLESEPDPNGDGSLPF